MTKLRAEVFRKAAEIVTKRQSANWVVGIPGYVGACAAIALAADDLDCDELECFRKLFSPLSGDMYWFGARNKYNSCKRETALLLMAAMVEAGDA